MQALLSDSCMVSQGAAEEKCRSAGVACQLSDLGVNAPRPLALYGRLSNAVTQPSKEDSLKHRPAERALNLSDRELAMAGSLLTEFLRSFERSLDERRVMPALDRKQLSDLFAKPFPELGSGVESLFRDINEKVLPNCTTIAH